jgi:hypothetical protein
LIRGEHVKYYIKKGKKEDEPQHGYQLHLPVKYQTVDKIIRYNYINGVSVENGSSYVGGRRKARRHMSYIVQDLKLLQEAKICKVDSKP